MKRLLIIEDDPDIRESITDIFQENGYTVYTAHNGITGIKLAEDIKPMLIICDLSMPGISGFKVKEELTKSSDTSSIPFIFLTAHNNFDDMRRAMELGADDYIVKPVKSKQLLDIVSKRLERLHQLNLSANKDYKEFPSKLSSDNKILLIKNRKHYLVSVKDIVTIEASDYNTTVYLVNGESYMMKRSLNNWEEKLSDTGFIRVHRKIIINVDNIESIDKWFKGTYKIKLKDYPNPVYSSQRYSTIIRKRFNL